MTSKLCEDELLYLDELRKEPIWVPKSKFIQYIRSTYLVTPKIYFDKVMELRGLTEVDKCPICGKELKWVGIFSGYSRTCSPPCRNVLISKGNDDLVVVTNKGTITHVLNQEFITKYKVSKEIQSGIPKEITLSNLIEYLTSNNCLWISGYNSRSIRYAGDRLFNLKLINHLDDN